MSKTLAAMFENYDFARRAKDRILDEGIDDEDLIIITNTDWENEQPEYNYDEGEMLNRRTLGSMVGLFNPSNVYLQQFGTVDTNTPYAAVFPSRELFSAFNETGIPDSHRRYYRSELKKGKALLKFTVADRDEERIAHLLHSIGSTNVDSYKNG